MNEYDDIVHRTGVDLGQRLRAARLRARLTLAEVAARTGLSEGFLSRLERGQATTSIANLIGIADTLGVAMHDLFTEQGQEAKQTRVSVHRSAPAATFREIESTGYRWVPLAGGAPLDRMEVFHLVFPPHNRMKMLVSHPGQEHCYVLSGEILFDVAGERHRLRAGEGIFIDSLLPHRAENAGDTEAHVLMTVARSPGETAPHNRTLDDWWRLPAEMGESGLQ
jgi:transcriptional regulator with XRE-family HTH domain